MIGEWSAYPLRSSVALNRSGLFGEGSEIRSEPTSGTGLAVTTCRADLQGGEPTMRPAVEPHGDPETSRFSSSAGVCRRRSGRSGVLPRHQFAAGSCWSARPGGFRGVSRQGADWSASVSSSFVGNWGTHQTGTGRAASLEASSTGYHRCVRTPVGELQSFTERWTRRAGGLSGREGPGRSSIQLPDACKELNAQGNWRTPALRCRVGRAGRSCCFRGLEPRDTRLSRH